MQPLIQRAALGALIAAALVACGGSTATSPSPSALPTGTASAIEVTLADFKITPSELTSGASVAIDVTSDGPTPHNLTIRDGADEVVAATDDLSTGESDRIEVELAPGEYTIFCALAGHESLGMRGTLSVATE